jgi:predicted TPR repeat methyltransferase
VTADADGGKRDPLKVDVPQALEMAVQFHRQGWLEPAEEFYRAVLRLEPGEPNALHYLGVLLHQTGKSEAAIAMLHEAIAARPDWADAYNNLGNILKESDRIDEAASAYAHAAELEPHNPTVLNNLGVVLKALDRGDDAEAVLRQAIKIAPGHAEAWFNLGNMLMRRGQVEEAADMLQTAVKLKPGRRGAWNRLVQILGRLGRKDDARRVFDEWLAFKPDDDSAKHLKAAILGEGDAPKRADDGYVRDVFGGFAEDFDDRLASLKYRAPELVAGAIDRLVPPDRRRLAILDAGAGTGLCGPLLKPRAARLIGVDLSKEMLAFAEKRGVYDALHEAELTSWLTTTDERFDFAVCADTLCYFGVIEDVLRGFARVLAPGGLLAFTVERSPEGDAGSYRLQYHGRYSHTEAYVRDAVAAAGLRVRELVPEPLRLELGEPVAGLLVVVEQVG